MVTVETVSWVARLFFPSPEMIAPAAEVLQPYICATYLLELPMLTRN